MSGAAEGRDWLLLLLAAGGEGTSMDPIRIMKGAFLLTQQLTANEQSAPYEFVAYHYGPCAFAVYSDLDSLVADGLAIAEHIAPSRTWPVYRVTRAGALRARTTAQQIGEVWADYVSKLRSWLDRQSFDSLLRYVYATYPQYAAATLLPELANQS